MITIDQLLESVDLDFEPRFITKDMDGWIRFFPDAPIKFDTKWIRKKDGIVRCMHPIKLSEFDGKDWTECIYEVPRKTTGKIKKLECYELADKEFNPTGKFEPMCFMTLIETINSLVDAVNELMGDK